MANFHSIPKDKTKNMKAIINCSMLLVVTIFLFLVISGFSDNEQTTIAAKKWSKDTPISVVLNELGEKQPAHAVKNMSAEQIKKGEELVKIGKTTSPKGRKAKFISKYYACTSCHNVVREDPDLTKVSPDPRLEYAIDNNIPYLQGSTFWGIVNRKTWYNDDYVQKYGDLLDKARNDLKESIQVCAVYCSQGRKMKKWEVDATMAYLWSIQMKMGDLNLSDEEWAYVNEHAGDKSKQAEIKELINSKYLDKSPATFADPPENKQAGYTHKGRPEMGEAVYRLSCMHCHRANGESEVILDKSKSSFKWLKRHMTFNSQLSMYEVIRHGTYDALGHQEYMPQYTLEKLSDQQIEDLRAYIEMGAGSGFSALPDSDLEDAKKSSRFGSM